MSIGEGALGELMVAYCASDPSKRVNFIGEVVAYSSSPSYHFRGVKGTSCQVSWLANLCRKPTAAEEVAYWKARARKAEGVSE